MARSPGINRSRRPGVRGFATASFNRPNLLRGGPAGSRQTPNVRQMLAPPIDFAGQNKRRDAEHAVAFGGSADRGDLGAQIVSPGEER